jgi:hypothetical protein
MSQAGGDDVRPLPFVAAAFRRRRSPLDEMYVKILLGHANIENTARYLGVMSTMY